MQVVFLDSQTGKELRTLRLVTSGSDFSGVYPTHDGRFLVRTGQVLRLYSPSFDELASRSIAELPAKDTWVLQVLPSGRHVYAESWAGKRVATVLDADTLETVANLRPSDVALWPQVTRLFPDLAGSLPQPGFFTPEGNWQTVDLHSKRASCVFWTVVHPTNITQRLGGGRGCEQLKLFSSDGRLFWNVPVRNEAHSLLYDSRLLAVEIHRHLPDPFDTGVSSKPLRISVYDLATKSEKCSIPIIGPVSDWWSSMFYDVSAAGTVAVIQGNTLSFYQP